MSADEVASPPPEAATERLFVYGTLRTGGGNQAMLRGGALLREASVPGSLYHFGDFPGLVLDRLGRVSGEVWRCTAETLARLDAYEGVDAGLFRRVRVQVEGLTCWTYVVGPALSEEIDPDRRIASGTWDPSRRDAR